MSDLVQPEQPQRMPAPWEKGWTPELVKGVPIPPKPSKPKPAKSTSGALGDRPPTHGPDGRWLPGVSGNVAGRKPGSLDKRQKLQTAFADDAVEIVRVIIAKAISGDMQAANIALARIAPPLKQQAEKVQFTLDPDGPLAVQAEQILKAVADGHVDPETGKLLIECIKSVSGIRAIEELESRITQLEGKATLVS